MGILPFNRVGARRAMGAHFLAGAPHPQPVRIFPNPLRFMSDLVRIAPGVERSTAVRYEMPSAVKERWRFPAADTDRSPISIMDRPAVPGFLIAPGPASDNLPLMVADDKGRKLRFSRKDGPFVEIPGDGYTVRIIEGEKPMNPVDDNVDVFVYFPDGRKYVGYFYTPQNIVTLLDRWREAGDETSGRYFWDPHAVSVSELTRDAIAVAVQSLIADGKFERAFDGPFFDVDV